MNRDTQTALTIAACVGVTLLSWGAVALLVVNLIERYWK